MKQMKKCLTLALAVLLVLGLSVPVYSAVDDTGYSDVSPNAWYAEAVTFCREHDLMNGVGGSRFDPDGPLTRAALATVIYRMEGEPAVTGTDSFTDTDDGVWYSNAVLWASQRELMGGYGGIFGTDDPVTRQDMATILWRYVGSPAAGTASFQDSTAISGYAASAVAWAESHSIVAPVSGNTFAPADNATRAQIAAALMNYTMAQETTPSGSARVLVAYFSRYGNTDYDSDVDATTSASVVVDNGQRQGTTELIARMIAEQTGGELHLIETADSYSTDFNDVVDQNHQEIASGARPELTSSVDASRYDVIFVGYPVWASTAPTPVLSFLEGLNLSGKTVIPFCTHDGYGAGSSYSAIRNSSAGATVEQGLTIDSSRASTSEGAVTSWLNGLNLPSAGTTTAQPTQGETTIRITIEEQELEGVLYDSAMARQFIAQLPQTITMTNYGGREVYGGIDQPITVEGEGQLRFDDGDITYCPSNNTAAIFYSQSDRPNLTMTVYPIGKVTSDLSIFPDLPSRVEITFEVISK
ncbi:MAG: cyclophilin-like fold protein [Ruminococcus flavefaciens]|nr:cyclophilin-like fold protein [Ruminococcus flavefaciens]